VTRGNAHVRKAGLVGQNVTFDLTKARIVVADTDGDGSRTTADGEHLCVGRVPIADAIRSLNNDAMRCSPLVIGLQWLALNLKRVPELLD